MCSNNQLGLYQGMNLEHQSPEQPGIPLQEMPDVRQYTIDEQMDTQEQLEAQFVQDIQVMHATKAMQGSEPMQLQPERMRLETVAPSVQSQEERYESAVSDAPIKDEMLPQTKFQKQNSQPESQSHAHTENQIPDSMQPQIQALIATQGQLQLQECIAQQQPQQVNSLLQNQPAHHEQQTKESDLQRTIQQMRVQLDALKSPLEARQQKLQPQQISQHPHPQLMQQSQLEEYSSPDSQYKGMQAHIQHLKPTSEHGPSHHTVSGFSDVSLVRTARSGPQLSEPLAQLPDTHDPLFKFLTPSPSPFEISYLDDSDSSTHPTEVATCATVMNPPKRRRLAKNDTNKDSDTGEDAPILALDESSQLQNRRTENSFGSDLPLSVQSHLRNQTAAPRFGSSSDMKMYEAMKTERLARRMKCTKCNEVFASSDALNRHFRRTHADPPKQVYICQECQQVFRSKWNLCVHMNNAHIGELTDVCEMCGARFSSKRTLTLHRNKQHPRMCTQTVRKKNTKLWDCPICEYGSQNSSNVIRHFFKKHTGDVLMECLRGCGMAFESEETAKLHFPSCMYMPSIDE